MEFVYGPTDKVAQLVGKQFLFELEVSSTGYSPSRKYGKVTPWTKKWKNLSFKLCALASVLTHESFRIAADTKKAKDRVLASNSSHTFYYVKVY